MQENSIIQLILMIRVDGMQASYLAVGYLASLKLESV